MMSAISRRDFFKHAAGDAVIAGVLSAGALALPIGCQTYPVRKMIGEDFPGTIKQLASAGFEAIELCSPVGYADSGFGSLAKYQGAELRKILRDEGVSCVSSHF